MAYAHKKKTLDEAGLRSSVIQRKKKVKKTLPGTLYRRTRPGMLGLLIGWGCAFPFFNFCLRVRFWVRHGASQLTDFRKVRGAPTVPKAKRQL